ncbi:hypothetical protein RRG08_029236 [Elysia crispata]|uniref:Uncharacterized protein n=1 Tax=Elysia crispata TaxID=231223 RepID=A0AAE1E0W6_9GAST|nr:hypothetical protein RRG08_029236 [Elysia crispata]
MSVCTHSGSAAEAPRLALRGGTRGDRLERGDFSSMHRNHVSALIPRSCTVNTRPGDKSVHELYHSL